MHRFSLVLVAALCAAQPSFREHVIATDLKGGYQVVIADMNHDGKPDLLALASGMQDLYWFENPAWERHVIAGPFPRMINVAPFDTDGDGIPELVLAYKFENQASRSVGDVAVLRQEGGQWKAKEIDRLTTSHRIRWADPGGDGKKVAVNAPLTGAKAEPPDYQDATPLVYYAPGDWKRQDIATANRGIVHGIYVYDWDGDRRDDILTAGFSGIERHWMSKDRQWHHESLAKGDPSAWPKGGSSDIAIGRAGKDRFLAAIEPWHGSQVVVYRGKKLERQVIDPSLVDGHTILTADFDGDRRDEIVAGFRGAGRSVYLYKLDKEGKTWQRKTVDDGGIAAAACAAADLNGDGRTDLTCIGSATTNLKWYENVR